MHTSLPHKSLHTCKETTTPTPQVVGERIHLGLAKQQEQGINVKPHERMTGNRISGVWNRGHDLFRAEVWTSELLFYHLGLNSQLVSSWGSGSNPITVTIGSGVFKSMLEKLKITKPRSACFITFMGFLLYVCSDPRLRFVLLNASSVSASVVPMWELMDKTGTTLLQSIINAPTRDMCTEYWKENLCISSQFLLVR